MEEADRERVTPGATVASNSGSLMLHGRMLHRCSLSSPYRSAAQQSHFPKPSLAQPEEKKKGLGLAFTKDRQ